MPTIQGTVKDSNGNFAQRIVRAYRRHDGALIAEGLSNPTTGAFSLTTSDFAKYFVVVHDSDAFITYLPLNGVNGATTFPEWGGKAVTAVGDAKISTAQSKFGGASAYFDGAGDYLSMPASPDLAFGSRDFTIETQARFDVVSADYAICGQVANGSVPNSSISWRYSQSNGGLRLALYSGTNVTTTQNFAFVPTAGVFYHLALVRKGPAINCFVNRTKLAETLTFAPSLNTSTEPFRIGVLNDALQFPMNGYLDDFKISNGKAQYTESGAALTAPHGDSMQMANAMVFDFLTPA